MADLRKDIVSLREPGGIKNAELASSPYVLRKIIAADPGVQRVIAAGDKALPIIADEIRSTDNEYALAAFAYVVENIQPQAAADILGSAFKLSIKKPGPFFVHFAAHAIRAGSHLPVKPLQMVYSESELNEAQRQLH